MMVATVTKEQKHEGSEPIDYHYQCRYKSFKIILLISRMEILPPIKGRENVVDNPYQTCLKEKMVRSVILKKSNSKTQELSKLLHNDLCGPMQTHSIKDNVYMILYLNDMTRWIHLNFLNKKSQQLREFKIFQRTFIRQQGFKIKFLRTDRRGEYVSNKVQSYLKE